MAADTLLTAIRAHLGLEPTHKVIMEPIKKGASGRTIIRLCPEGHPDYIGIYYTLDRADNANFLPVAHFLTNAGVKVPEVIYDNMGRQLAIVEDLGNEDLLSKKELSFEERLPLYRKAFEQLDKLYYTRAPKDFELQPEFDEALYRWEQEYFFEHFVGTHLGQDPSELEQDSVLQGLAKRLGASAPHLVHRDFQSQNLMVKDNDIYLIDFQGLRRGRQEYDLASLIYDPYLNHSEDEVAKLLELWEEVSEEEPIAPILADCATQRLMQAIGAFANIVHHQGDDWYAEHIKTGCQMLKRVIKGTPQEEVLKNFIS